MNLMKSILLNRFVGNGEQKGIVCKRVIKLTSQLPLLHRASRMEDIKPKERVKYDRTLLDQVLERDGAKLVDGEACENIVKNNTDILPLDTIITFGKYKNKFLKDLLEDNSYVNWIIENNISPNSQELFLKSIIYYNITKINTQPIKGGNLTLRVKDMLLKRNYTDICESNNIYMIAEESCNIISNEFCEFIQNLHRIYPSGAGCFIDYLFRRILSELINNPFEDTRTTIMISPELSVKRENKDNICTIEELIQNEFNISITKSYEKVKNIKIATSEIILEIFIVSLAHNLFFGDIEIDLSKEQIIYLSCAFKKEYIFDIIKLINTYNGSKFALNPALGAGGVGADCDLIIDDKLFDFKVTKGDNTKKDLLQLLGYASLISLRKHIINEVYIINLYKNQITKYIIKNWTKQDDFLKYMNIDILITLNDQILFKNKITHNKPTNSNCNNKIIKCSICNKSGHNKRSCKDKCNNVTL